MIVWGSNLNRVASSTTIYILACFAVIVLSQVPGTATAETTTNPGHHLSRSVTLHPPGARDQTFIDSNKASSPSQGNDVAGISLSFSPTASFILLGTGLIIIAGWFKRKHRNHSTAFTGLHTIEKRRDVNIPTPAVSSSTKPMGMG